MTIHGTDQRVCAFYKPASIAIPEIIENEVAPSLDGLQELLEGISNLAFLDFLAPFRVACDGFIVGARLVDFVKLFLSPVDRSQPGELTEPAFEEELLLRREIVVAFEKNVSITFQCAPLPIGQCCVGFFPCAVNNLIDQFDHMEFVYYCFCLWNMIMYEIQVRPVHINNDYRNNIFSRKCGEISPKAFFFALWQHLDNSVGFEIGEHGTGLAEQVDFI